MNTKQRVQQLLEHLPHDVSLLEVARQVRFIADTRKGFESYGREGGVTIEQAKAAVSAWARKPGFYNASDFSASAEKQTTVILSGAGNHGRSRRTSIFCGFSCGADTLTEKSTPFWARLALHGVAFPYAS